MSDLALATAQTRYALRGFLRQPRTLIVTVAMPVVLLVLFNTIFRSRTTVFDGRHVSEAAWYTASMVSYEIMITGFSSLLISVTTARERGLLKRFRGTPMPSGVYLAAQIVETIVVVAVAVAVLVAVGVVFYHVKMTSQTLVGLVVYTVAGTACFCSVALAMTRVCTTTDSASAIGPSSAIILSFISGVFITVDVMPAWLLDFAKLFPLEHLARGLQTAFVVPHSSGITAANLAVLAIWGVGGLVVAVRTFRWEPLGAGA
jgi:ABC-2 type transport system permease protein